MATGLYVCSEGVAGSARLCCTFSQPPFSVLMVPPETECVRLLFECVSVCWCVCLACCVPPLLVLGGSCIFTTLLVSKGLVVLVVWLKC